ncbi:hypothetical protein SLEP1_g33946 [Rubroshorea leprosula]|uniref:Uncharacterized protein n=1 Tax=Rubroshorea leprosula TaxID=152421 RepID=A0AAV5KIC2_9ROSI|nr:hypothetical protein SLEP1_g33946 [Rubroshorea leprosula]
MGNALLCKRFKAILAKVVLKFHFFQLELHGPFMWLIFLYWLIKNNDQFN